MLACFPDALAKIMMMKERNAPAAVLPTWSGGHFVEQLANSYSGETNSRGHGCGHDRA